ncbi:hypothetical protein D3C71_1769860 [compost metagenome]
MEQRLVAFSRRFIFLRIFVVRSRRDNGQHLIYRTGYRCRHFGLDVRSQLLSFRPRLVKLINRFLAESKPIVVHYIRPAAREQCGALLALRILGHPDH